MSLELEEPQEALTEQEEVKEEAIDPIKDILNPRGTKVPLVAYILTIVLFATSIVLLSLEGGANDLDWSRAIFDWGNLPENEGLYGFLTVLPQFMGGLLGIIILVGVCLLIYLLGLTDRKKAFEEKKFKSIVKYASILVLSGLLIVGLSFLLRGIFARQPPEQAIVFSAWYDISVDPNPDPWMTGSFPAQATMLAGITFGTIYWFNSKKLIPVKVVFIILSILFIVGMALGQIFLGDAYLSDVIVGGFLSYWICAGCAKGILSIRIQELWDVYMRTQLPFDHAYEKIARTKAVLNLNEVPRLIAKGKKSFMPIYEEELERVADANEKAEKMYEKEKAKAEKDAEKTAPSRPEELLPEETIVKVKDLFEEAESKAEAEVYEVNEIAESIAAILNDLQDEEKPDDRISETLLFVDDINEILEDNKEFALNLLNESIEDFNAVIAKAEKEVLNFSKLIAKAENYIAYVERFIRELKELDRTKGSRFEEYMQRNFLYVI